MRQQMPTRVFLTVFVMLAAMAASTCAIDSENTAARQQYVPPAAPSPYVPETAKKSRKVVILHTNDEHSHLLALGPAHKYPFVPKADGSIDPVEMMGRICVPTDAADPKSCAPAKDRQTQGGMVRRQFLVNQIRATSPDPVLVVSAGDATMGTLFAAATEQAAPDYVAMAMLGYDFMTFGNHDFDFGPDVLAAALRAANNMLFGAAVPVVASNTYFDDMEAGGSGSDLYAQFGAGNSGSPIMPWATKMLSNGLKVGVLGIMGFEAAMEAGAAYPIAFSVNRDGSTCRESSDCAGPEEGFICRRRHCVDPFDWEAAFAALASEIQPLVDYLRDKERVDLVIALSHQGQAEDQVLAMLTHGIDVIVGGHSHQELPPMIMPSGVGTGNSILVQAGDYGRLLGKLTIMVDPDGAVTWDLESTDLLPVDYTLDHQILADPEAFGRAAGLTKAVIGPLVGGLNQQIGPLLGMPNLFGPWPTMSSNHDLLGDYTRADSPLSHLVTDADWATVFMGACLGQSYPGDYVVAVQANGVLRETIRFGEDAPNNVTTAADIFQAVPLGGSPFSKAAPGFPLVMFRLDPISLYAALDVGVTVGLQSDAFFLAYSRLRVTYDRTLGEFDADTFDYMSPDPAGRVTKIEASFDNANWVTIFSYDRADTATPWIMRWANIDPQNDTIVVITNLYLASFMELFGVHPRHVESGAEILPIDQLGSMGVLAQTILCQIAVTADCGNSLPNVGLCWKASMGNLVAGQWPTPLVEVKEWAALIKFMAQAFPAGIPDVAYAADDPRRVIQSP